MYVILTKNNTLYCGYTDDVAKRYEMHCSGKGAKYTRANKPQKLLHFECFDSKSEAMRAERVFKALKRTDKEKFLRELNKKT